MSLPFYHDLICTHCGQRETLHPDQLLEKLRAAGIMRRAQTPDAGEIVAIATGTAERLVCAACGQTGLRLAEVATEESDDDWGDPVPCERCNALIPAERIALFPGTKLCVTCQQASERGDHGGEADYCPRCGTIMQLRKARGGITRYVMECPSCGR